MVLLLNAKGQDPEYRHFEKYSQARGLSSYNVKKIFKDSKGFLWIATQDGINRFDGKNFVRYTHNSESSHRIDGADIREIIEDSINKKFWIIPTQGNINSIDISTGNIIDNIQSQDPYQDGWRLSMELYNNKLWIGSFTGVKVYDISTKKFERNLYLPLKKGALESAFEAGKIFIDLNGNLWVCFCGYGIIIYNGKTKEVIKEIPFSLLNITVKSGNIKFNDGIFMQPNKILFATSQGLRSITFDKKYQFLIDNKPCKGNDHLNEQPVEAICKTKEDGLLVAAHSNLFQFNNDLSVYSILKESATGAEGNWLNSVHCIFNDSNNNIIWLGSQQGASSFKDGKPVFWSYYFDEASNNKLEHVRSLLPTNGKKIFVGMLNGLGEINSTDKATTIFDKNNTYHHVYLDRANKINISRADGMFIYNNKKLAPINKYHPEFNALGKNPTNSHLFLGDSIIVLGSENETGIFIWNYKRHTVAEINKIRGGVKLASNIVNNIFYDDRKNLWVLSDKVITLLSNNFSSNKFIELADSVTKKPLTFFFDMCQASGYYWIASYSNGIIQLDSAFKIIKVYNTKNGLCDDGVYQVFPMNNKLIITTNNGLSVFNIGTHTFQNYFEADGLYSSSFEEVAGVMKDGLIYAGGLKGFSIINPALFSTNNSPPLIYINKIILETSNGKFDSSNLYFQSYQIPDNAIQTNIYFSGLNFRNPGRTTYAYRIKEKSTDWINLSDQNFVTLIGLSPGTYHLQVKAANEDGVWSAPKELALEFLPKWYQTWWFKLLIFAAATSILYAFYRYRIQQIKKQHEIRKNIATDLHDDLGSTLNSVKVFTNLAISGVEQENSLQQVKQNLEEATMGLRDMIWVLDDSLDTVDELVTRLNLYALPVANASDINTEIKADFDTRQKQLSKEEKRNLFLVCKEAINNSIKYSGASEISLYIIPEGKKIKITISDNGKGFDIEKVKKGYGLKNMQYRAGQIKYGASIISAPGSGTQIIIKPL